MESKNFVDVFKKIQRVVDKSSKQALNKTMINTRTKYAKDVAEATGLPSTKVKKRSRIIQATTTFLGATLEIGVRVIFSASDFKPLVRKVMSRIGQRYGATIKIQGSRDLVPGGFIVSGKNSGKQLVMERTSNSQYPIQLVKVDVFVKIVEDMKPGLQSFAEDTFKKRFNEQLKYNLDESE